MYLLLCLGCMDRCLLALQRYQALLLAAGQADEQAAEHMALHVGRRGMGWVEDEGTDGGWGL